MKILWMYRVHADVNTHITTWRETHRQLRDRHEIHYIFPYEREAHCFTEQATLIRRLRLRGLGLLHFLVAGFGAFVRLTRELRPDVVIFDQFTVLYSLWLLTRGCRPALILDLRQAKYSNEGAWHAGRILRTYTKWILRLNRRYHDGISYISEGLRQQLLSDMRMELHSRYLIWPSGVDPDVFRPRSHRNDQDAGTHLRVFFHGSVTNDRGLAETIAGLSLLLQRDVPVLFTIVGDGAFLPTLRQLTEAAGVMSHVRFLPLVPYEDVPALIAESDVCIMAYPTSDYWEGNVPIKLLEYMAMEKIILTTPVQAFRTITRNASCAHFIPDNTPASIADGLEYLYRHRADLPEWGKVGRDIVCRHYTWKAIAYDLDAFLREVATEARSHREQHPSRS